MNVKEGQGAVEAEQPTTDPIDQGAAMLAKVGFDGAVSELATNFKAHEYDRVRIALAKRLGVRTSTLDRAYDQARGRGSGQDQSGQGEDLDIDDPEPWEVSVDGAKLLNELAFTFRRYAILPRHGDKVLALWVVHTYAYNYRDCTPILGLTSPQKRCGKTTVMGLVSELASRALPASNITSAGVFRVISKYKPTLLIDEADTFLKGVDPVLSYKSIRYAVSEGHI